MNETNERRELFYLVCKENRLTADDMHFTRESAETEAARLAKKFPGRTVHVLMVTKSAVVNPVAWIDYEGSDKPAPPYWGRTS